MRIGVLYEVKDKLSGGLNKIKQRMKGINDMQKKARLNTREYFGSFRKKIKESIPSFDKFSLKNSQMFDAMKSEVPFLGRLGGLLSNPYVLAAAAVVGLVVGLVKLGTYMVETTQEIKKHQKEIRATFGITGEELENTTAEIMAISDVLKVEDKELAIAANTLKREYEDTGITIGDSLNLIKQGIMATGGNFDLAEVREYASQMKAAGVSAEEFIALSALGIKEGIYSDKGVDAFKATSRMILKAIYNLEGAKIASCSK